MRAHAEPCDDCPIAKFPPDEAALDTREHVRAGLLTYAEAVYVCGWRPEARCAGAAEFFARAAVSPEEGRNG